MFGIGQVSRGIRISSGTDTSVERIGAGPAIVFGNPGWVAGKILQMDEQTRGAAMETQAINSGFDHCIRKPRPGELTQALILAEPGYLGEYRLALYLQPGK
jgi:hypothetical protein